MNFEKASRETLRYLFHEYQKAPTVVFMINHLIKKYNVDPVEFTDYMLENLWIRERWVYPDLAVSCKITIKGIEEINPEYVRTKLKEIVGGLAEAEGHQSLIEILQHKIEEYAIALDMVRQLESLQLVSTEQRKGDIIVSLTEKGWRFYEKSSKTFFTMMSVA